MSNDIANRGEILLYSDENGREFVNVIFKDETFWLTQKAMSELFDCTTDNISRHLKNIFTDGELDKDSVTEKFSVTAADGKTIRHSITTSMPLLQSATGSIQESDPIPPVGDQNAQGVHSERLCA